MKTVLNIKTDKEVKEKAKKTAAQLGLPLSTVVNAYLKEFIRERAVRFSLEPQLRPEIEKELIQAKKDFEKGKNISTAFNGAYKAIACLKKEVRKK